MQRTLILTGPERALRRSPVEWLVFSPVVALVIPLLVPLVVLLV
jgi:hypothetical protein